MLSLLVWLLLLLLIGAPIAVVARAMMRARDAGREVKPAEVLDELIQQARSLPTTLHEMGQDVRENVVWLSRQWRSAAGMQGGYGKAEQDDDNDDADGMDVSTDDFAPMDAELPSRLARKDHAAQGQPNGLVELRPGEAPPEVEDASPSEERQETGRTVMRL